MLAWGRQENESARAFQAFEVYRDLGVERSLVKVGQTLGKSRALIERWSVQHDWVNRVEALADRDEMLRREAVEAHVREGAEDRGKREAALLERGLEARERAMEKAMTMLAWPLAEQRRVEEGPDGEAVTYVFSPAKWSMGTAVTYFQMATGSASPSDAAEPEEEFDFEGWTEEEISDFIQLSGKLRVKRREGRSDG